jgi:D-3-phosphoglycerate dehydrogenase
MPLKILVSAPYMQSVIDRFRPIFEKKGIELVLPIVNERMEEEDLLACIADIDGVISGDDRFSAAVLKAAPKLKVISKWGTGIDSIDIEACRKLGIQVRNTQNAFSIPVADSVIGYMLCFCRQIPWMDRDIRRNVWNKIPGRALQECVLGIIGVGNVGKVVAKRSKYFGMKVLGNDIIAMSPEFLAESKIEMVSKEELLNRADFVSLNCDLNPTSHHMMNASMFSRMKPTAIVINTSRGPVIKETDLIKALTEKQIGGAALDVFENEPLTEDNPLRTMDNVLLAPHNANSSPKAWEAVHHSTIQNLFDVLEGNSG